MAKRPASETESDESGIFAKTLENIFVPDIIKKAVIVGLKSVLGSEEVLRNLASAIIPRDALNYLLQQIDNSKNEILRIVSREIRSFLEQVNIGYELQRILTSLTFEIKTEIRFTPNEDSTIPTPSVQASLRTRKEPRRKKN